MDARLGWRKDFVLVAAAVGLSTFSLSCVEAGWMAKGLLVMRSCGTGDGGGKKLEILRKGILGFEGPEGGFFSDMVISGCFKDDEVGGFGQAAAAAMALLSCFSLVFLSSAN